jgi:hypothetical protein
MLGTGKKSPSGFYLPWIVTRQKKQGMNTGNRIKRVQPIIAEDLPIYFPPALKPLPKL